MGNVLPGVDVRGFGLFCSVFSQILICCCSNGRQTRHWKAFQDAATSVCPAVPSLVFHSQTVFVVVVVLVVGGRKRPEVKFGLSCCSTSWLFLLSYSFTVESRERPHSFPDTAIIYPQQTRPALRRRAELNTQVRVDVESASFLCCTNMDLLLLCGFYAAHAAHWVYSFSVRSSPPQSKYIPAKQQHAQVEIC